MGQRVWALRGAVLGAAGLVLSACGGGAALDGAANRAPCPRIAILADGADLTRFRPGSEGDLTGMAVDARLIGFDARCDFAGRDRRAIEVRVAPRFQAERGPAAEGRVAELPWFVAVTDQGDSAVLIRESHVTRVTFAANAASASATGQPARITLPVAEGLRAGDYTLRLSFQLTPAELETNRRRGPR